VKSLEIEQLNIPGVLLIKREVNKDFRGNFFKPYSKVELGKNNISFSVAEVLYSTSGINVIRGMHFQNPPYQQAKLVSVTSGEIMDVVLDIRKDSPFYGKSISIDLKQNDGKILYVPSGFAHGFISRHENSTVLYIVDREYSSVMENGVRYDSFGFDWESDDPKLSSRDLNFRPLDSFRSPFKYGDDSN
jgi:dTDP-4-dehydrorhamnose 3,5-epimerase/CDP-3, 6-dideoxy-D-glycero-D-glycero-4-hexulose-5-epimerase